MFKFNIKFLLIIFFVTLVSCGYEPIFSKKNNIIYIKEIQYSGSEIITSELKLILERYKIKKNTNQNITLIINSSESREIIQRTTQGEPNSYEITLSVIFEVKNNENTLSKRTIKKRSTYAKKNTKSQEKDYENRIIKNMSRQIANQIIMNVTQKLK